MLEDEGYKLMGAAFEVYNELGHGLAEEIYQQSLEIELAIRSIPFQTKRDLHVFYKGRCLETVYRPDLLVWDAIVVELKAISALTPDHEGQLINYMRIAQTQVGYLINFGKKGDLEWKRFVVSDLHRSRAKSNAATGGLSLH